SCSWIVWRLPEWKIVTAANAHLVNTAVDSAECTGLRNGVLAALEHGAEDLVIAGDFRLKIRESLGIRSCGADLLMSPIRSSEKVAARMQSAKYLHVTRDYNAAAN
ncbi:hypothetical protein PHYSODRAFT_403398, partial [Phytophthora sojae]